MAVIDIIEIEALDVAAFESVVDDLADVLVDAVESGAGVSFLAGLDLETARAFWREQAADIAAGRTVPFVARSDGPAVGVVLLVTTWKPNADYRAEIVKLLVHRSHRRRGIATALMTAAEDHARRNGRWLLSLDTWSGSDADRLYRSLGWHAAGEIPDYARRPDGTPAPATFFWKDLRA